MVCDVTNLEECGFKEQDFLDGKHIDHWRDDVIFQAKKVSNDGEPDDALQNHLMIPIYSRRLTEQLLKAKIGGIQFLPVNILKSDNTRIDGFAVANITEMVCAFDFDKSKYDRFRHDFPNPNVRGKIAGVIKFVLKETQIQGRDIFRLGEYQWRFFVSERFKEIFEKNKFSGYSFVRVELT